MEGNKCYVVTALLAVIYELAFNCNRHCDGDYYVIPLVNPDGYEYARNFNPYWIKNRQPFNVSSIPSRKISSELSLNDLRQEKSYICYGVRLNYNYPPQSTFHITGSEYPCSNIHRGPEPAYAPEIKAVIHMKTSIPKLRLGSTFMAIHDYTLTRKNTHDKILWPYALEYENYEYENYKNLAYAAHQSVLAYDGHYMDYSSYHGGFRIQSGTSMDFWYSHQPSCYSFSWASDKTYNYSGTVILRAKRILAGTNGMITTMDTLGLY